ncbi:LemA family protein [Tsuneonella rigui]|uniref:LemA family protein n=1 Tax=Tsuneonella rigui TaxID=1708790 RepID=UPI000F7E7257|nr:LemA family protein [Tsuneonella rigui]
MTFTTLRRTFVVALAAIGLSACGINSIPTKEETAKAKWADVEAAFQARANLVPNLAEVAKGAAEQERGILTDVIEARAKATSIQITDADLTDPAKMAEYQAAQSQLSTGLGRLLANFEAYPDLKSITNYQMLQGQLEGVENKVRIAIIDYNEAVRDYNTEIRTFPSAIGANVIYGSKPIVPYKAVTPGAEVAPTLDMTPNGSATRPTGANDNTAQPTATAAAQ